LVIENHIVGVAGHPSLLRSLTGRAIPPKFSSRAASVESTSEDAVEESEGGQSSRANSPLPVLSPEILRPDDYDERLEQIRRSISLINASLGAIQRQCTQNRLAVDSLQVGQKLTTGASPGAGQHAPAEHTRTVGLEDHQHSRCLAGFTIFINLGSGQRRTPPSHVLVLKTHFF
jgi:hypothetical protein